MIAEKVAKYLRTRGARMQISFSGGMFCVVLTRNNVEASHHDSDLEKAIAWAMLDFDMSIPLYELANLVDAEQAVAQACARGEYEAVVEAARLTGSSMVKDEFLQVVAMSAQAAKDFFGLVEDPTDLGPADPSRYRKGARVWGFKGNGTPSFASGIAR